MVTWALLLATVLSVPPVVVSASGPPASATAAPDLQQWVAKIGQDKRLRANGLHALGRIMLVKGPLTSSQWHDAAVDLGEVQALSYLDIASLASTRWTKTLRRIQDRARGKDTGRHASLAAAAGIDAVVELTTASDGDAAIGRLYLPQAQGLKAVRQKQTPDDASAWATSGKMLDDLIGYNAVIMARDGAYLLMKTRDLSDAERLSGVILCRSQSELLVGDRAQKGCGFVTLAAGGRQYSVFRLVSVVEDGEVGAGTKVILAGPATADVAVPDAAAHGGKTSAAGTGPAAVAAPVQGSPAGLSQVAPTNGASKAPATGR